MPETDEDRYYPAPDGHMAYDMQVCFMPGVTPTKLTKQTCDVCAFQPIDKKRCPPQCHDCGQETGYRGPWKIVLPNGVLKDDET